MKQDSLLELLSIILKNGSPSSSADLPFEIGECYYIRTVTHHQTGRVKKIIGKFLILEDAAWIADSGRWKDAIESGTLSEVEPVNVQAFVNTDTIIDAYEWKHALPRTQL